MSLPALTLIHEGCSSLRLELRGWCIRFDPVAAPLPSDLTLLTWNELERLKGTVAAVEAGKSPRVIAAEPTLAWLRLMGPLDAFAPPVIVEGVRIEARAYRPIPYATPIEGLRKLCSGVRDPLRAAGRLRHRLGLPRNAPLVYQLALPGGQRLLHLNCALHQWTEPGWLAAAADEFGGADWTIVGMDFEQGPALVERIGAFRPRVVLVADLVFDVRRELNLPVEPLKPWVQTLRKEGWDTSELIPGLTYDLMAGT